MSDIFEDIAAAVKDFVDRDERNSFEHQMRLVRETYSLSEEQEKKFVDIWIASTNQSSLAAFRGMLPFPFARFVFGCALEPQPTNISALRDKIEPTFTPPRKKQSWKNGRLQIR